MIEMKRNENDGNFQHVHTKRRYGMWHNVIMSVTDLYT